MTAESLQEQASRARGTAADAPKVVRLLDVLAWRVPDNQFGDALLAWAEEVTQLVARGGDEA